jgi:hypothetical protein
MEIIIIMIIKRKNKQQKHKKDILNKKVCFFLNQSTSGA